METEIWRECASWFTRCRALRGDHKLNQSDSTIEEFAFTLRDGVLLCDLLNILDPESFDMKHVNQKPQMAQFLCLRNIKIFLQVCQEVYGLHESDLFDPSMLFDLSDFYKVINTLSKLSNCLKLRMKEIPGFNIPEEKTPSQEAIYGNLDSGISNDCKDTSVGEDTARIDKVYEELCCVNFGKEIVPITEKRDYVIRELIETEKKYVDVLNILQKKFMQPLKTYISEHDYGVMFFAIKELAKIHTAFYDQLRKACTTCSTQKLSDVFLGCRYNFTIIYGDYIMNLCTAKQTLKICSQSEVVKQQIDLCQQNASNGKFKLNDLLLMPTQRILKYHLLLDNLLRETQPHHEDFRGLERAHEAMVDVAEYVDKVKGDKDSSLRIIDQIQQSIVDWNTSENLDFKNVGHLSTDGEVKIKCPNDLKTKSKYYVFVFDNILLMCKPERGDKYSFKEILRLNEFKVEESTGRTTNLETFTRFNHSFFLVSKLDENIEYKFCLKAEAIRRKWIKKLQDVMDNIEPSASRQTEHKFVFQTFDKISVCSCCSKFLKGLFFQGYKCDNCGIAVHKACIKGSGECSTRCVPEIPPRCPFALSAPRIPLKSRSIIPTNGQHLPSWIRSSSDSKNFLSQHLWFVGEMTREKATNLLGPKIDGTFLVRIRPQGPTRTNESPFVLSLKTDEKVKHMKVYDKKLNDSSNYYLSESKFFPSLVDLINCYQQNSLEENFLRLNVRLQWPFRKITAVAEIDFNPSEPNQLPLKKGSNIVVLSKEGDRKGWWKGQINDRIAFFPKVYVREVPDTFQMNSPV